MTFDPSICHHVTLVCADTCDFRNRYTYCDAEGSTRIKPSNLIADLPGVLVKEKHKPAHFTHRTPCLEDFRQSAMDI